LYWAYTAKAEVLIALRRFDETEQVLLRSREFARASQAGEVAATADFAWQSYNLGLIHHRQGRDVQAAKMFREAFAGFEQALSKASPNRRTMRRSTGALRWMLVTCPLPQFRDAERSIAYSKEFLQQDPLSADYWNSLGIGHYRSGNWDDANEALKKSAELRDGPDVSDCYFLAMAHWRSGAEGKAHEWYQKGVRQEKDVGKGFDLDLDNFRRETKKVLGITDDEKENAAPFEVEAETEDTKPAEVRPDAADEPSPQSNN
jgi:tetratricopeptide (TPR) repeat protein